EEVTLAAGLSAAIGERRWLDHHTGRVRREAERRLLGLPRGGQHDRAERRADDFGAPAHCAAIVLDALAAKVLLLPIEWKAEPVFAVEKMRHHRGREQAATHHLLRYRDGFDLRFARFLVRFLVRRPRDHDPHRATSAVA